ncbi:hypothetical protein QZH41_006550 [Actinostola sp. cb2023]|nr:hypothetical protein QZH41_006550 [Actinostola sp. cb2023]
MASERKNQVLIDLDDPNIETREVSRSSTSSTSVEHQTIVVEEISHDQIVFKSKFEEAQLNLFDLEKELRGTREKLNHLQGACENTEEKLSALKDATFSYQSIVSRHEITFRTINEENRILKIQLSKMEDLGRELEDEKEKNSVLSDRVMVLERVKEHANVELERVNGLLDELQKNSDTDLDALRDSVKEYGITCTDLQKELDIKEEEIIKLRFQHTSELEGLNVALSTKHEDYILHAEKSESLSQECVILRQDKATGEENLLREIESLKLKYDQIDGEKGVLEKEKGDIYNELSGLEVRLRDLETLQAERFELKKENEELRARIEILAKENKDLEDKKSEFLDEIEKLEDRLKDFDGFQDDRDDLILRHKELKRKYDEVVAENSEFCDRINDLDDEVTKLKSELDEVSELKIKLERLQKEKRDLEDSERKQKNRINELERELRSAKRDSEDLADRLKNEKDRAEESAKKVTELKARIRELEKELNEKEEKVQELDEENRKLEEELDALSDTLDKGKAAYEKMADELDEVKDENEKLKKELEDMNAKEPDIVVVEEAPVAASAPVIDFSDDLEDARNENKRLEDQLEKVNDKYDNMYEELTKKIKLLEERCEILKQEIVEKEVIISHLRRDEIRYQETIKDLEKRLASQEDLSKENDALRKQINKLEEEVQFLTEELKNSDDISINEVAELEKEVKLLKAKVLELDKQAKEDEKESERLRKRSTKGDDDWKMQYNSLKIHFDSLERERDFVKRDKDRLHKEYVEVDDELQNIRAKHTRTKKQLDEANIEINTLGIRIRELERNTRPETVRSEIAELKRIINDKDEEIEELRNELQGIDGEEWPQKYESLKLKYEELDGEKDSLFKEKSELQRELRISAAKVAELEIKLNNGSGDEKRLREELRIYRLKVTEFEMRLEKDRKDDQRTIEKLRKRIAELEDEIKRLKKLLKDSDDNNKQDTMQGEVDDLEKEVILLTNEVEDKTVKLKDMTNENDDLYRRIKQFENRPEKIQINEVILSESNPQGEFPLMFEPIPQETSTLIVDVVDFPEITLGVLLRSKQRGVNRVPIRGRMLSEYEFTVEPLPGTVLVGEPVAMKVDIKDTPRPQHPVRIDGLFQEESISAQMVEVSRTAPDPFLMFEEPKRASPVALVLEASEVNPSQAQIIDIGEPGEPRPGAFQPVPPRVEQSPKDKDDQSMNVPRGKLVPIRAVIRDSTAVVQRAEPTMLSADDSVFDDRNFKPVDIGRSKSFHAGDTRKQQPQEESVSYRNGYDNDDFIYPRELHRRYEEEREVKAVKPSQYEPRVIDYNQNVDDGVKRGTTWKPDDENTPMERQRLSSSEKDIRRSVEEPTIREMRRNVQESAPMLESTPTDKQPPPIGFVQEKHQRHSVDERTMKQHRRDLQDGVPSGDRRQGDRRYPDEEPRLRQREDNRPIRKSKQERRRSFDDKKMRDNRRQKAREDEEKRRQGRDEYDNRNIGWDQRLMSHNPPKMQAKPEVMMWL